MRHTTLSHPMHFPSAFPTRADVDGRPLTRPPCAIPDIGANKKLRRIGRGCARELCDKTAAFRFRLHRHRQPRRLAPAKVRPGKPVPAAGPGTVAIELVPVVLSCEMVPEVDLSVKFTW